MESLRRNEPHVSLRPLQHIDGLLLNMCYFVLDMWRTYGRTLSFQGTTRIWKKRISIGWVKFNCTYVYVVDKSFGTSVYFFFNTTNENLALYLLEILSSLWGVTEKGVVGRRWGVGVSWSRPGFVVLCPINVFSFTSRCNTAPYDCIMNYSFCTHSSLQIP